MPPAAAGADDPAREAAAQKAAAREEERKAHKAVLAQASGLVNKMTNNTSAAVLHPLTERLQARLWGVHVIPAMDASVAKIKEKIQELHGAWSACGLQLKSDGKFDKNAVEQLMADVEKQYEDLDRSFLSDARSLKDN